MGGGFGGKESQAAQWACLAALAAHVTGRPAKCRLDRDDDMIMTGKRHDFRVDYAVGFDDDGPHHGGRRRARCRAAAIRPISRTPSATAPCSMPTTPISIRPRASPRAGCKTNTVSNTAFRGFGGPQGMVVAERVIDAIAIAIGRRPARCAQAQSLYATDRDVTPYGMKVEDNIALDDHRASSKRSSDYRARRKEIAAFNAASRDPEAGHLR